MFGLFSWIREQVRQAVVAGVEDGLLHVGAVNDEQEAGEIIERLVARGRESAALRVIPDGGEILRPDSVEVKPRKKKS